MTVIEDNKKIEELKGIISDAAIDLKEVPRRPSHDDLKKIELMDIAKIAATAGINTGNTAEHILGEEYKFDLTSTLERVILLEECARVNANAFMSMPGPSMSGTLMNILGDSEQQHIYNLQLIERPTWTFFALTEPEHGTNAMDMVTTAQRDGEEWIISGTKCFVGNAARADIGVVFARTGSGLFAVEAFVIKPKETSGFTATPMPMRGMPGAEQCVVQLDNIRVGHDALLGKSKRSSQRGMRAAVSVFEQLRPGVAALALGIAENIYELLKLELTDHHSRVLDDLAMKIKATRYMILNTARAIDAGTLVGTSTVKVTATRLAWSTALVALKYIGNSHDIMPMMLDLMEDAWAVQFMEGTHDIQLLQSHLAIAYEFA